MMLTILDMLTVKVKKRRMRKKRSTGQVDGKQQGSGQSCEIT